MKATRFAGLALAALGFVLPGCAPEDSAEKSEEGAEVASSALGAQYNRFEGFDTSGKDTYGVKGYLPPNSELAPQYEGMTESQRRGLSAWHLFAAERGDFFRTEQKVTWN